MEKTYAVYNISWKDHLFDLVYNCISDCGLLHYIVHLFHKSLDKGQYIVG